MGFIEVCYGGGIAIGPLYAQYVYQSLGYESVFYVAATLALGVSLLICRYFPSSVDSKTSDSPREDNDNSCFSLIKIPYFTLALICVVFNTFFVAWMEPILADKLEKVGVESESLGYYFFI